MRISDWSSDVCSSDLEDSVDIKDSNSASRWRRARTRAEKSMAYGRRTRAHIAADRNMEHAPDKALERLSRSEVGSGAAEPAQHGRSVSGAGGRYGGRSEEQTSELQSLMRISYADFCVKKKQRTILHD